MNDKNRKAAMSVTMTLLHLGGYVALLLWGIRMVQTGILRAFGGDLRHFLGLGLGNRWKAFTAGLGLTALLQSSTATGLLATSFLSSGFISLVPALAVMLGANVGSTLIVQVMTFEVWAFAPVLVLAGVIAFKAGGKTRSRDLGRAVIGLGLVVLSLHLMVEVMKPVEQAAAMREIFAMLTGEPLLNVVLAALLTWAMYSSVAVVLLVMSLASAQIVTPAAALALVIGANLGNVIPQYFASRADPEARRLALGNLIVRGVGCALAIPFLALLGTLLAAVEISAPRQVADFHTLFNVACAAVFIGLLDPLARLCTALLPASGTASDPGRPKYIGADGEAVPSVRLANAEREVLRMLDVVENMLRMFLDALQHDDRKLLSEIEQMDDTLDRLHKAVKLFLTEISREDRLEGVDARRCSDILAFTINLEHAGDILDKSLREIAAKKIKHKLNFSAEGFAEILAMHERLLDNLRLAMSVFMTGDERAARLLLDEKVRIRDMEQAATDNHLRRLREGRLESIETSALHLDIVRDFKRIAAHIASVAYPVLDKNGLLLKSRVAMVRIDSASPGAQPIPSPMGRGLG
jgi:phosphate:Na+ symporter